MNTKRNKMKRIIAFLPVCLMSLSLLAQEKENLVPNGSFEEASNKLRRLKGIEYAENWSSPTGVTADLFSSYAKMPEVLTPENVYGKEEPKDGENYAGIIIYSYNDKEERQYITTKLTTPMKKGMRYKVQFYASLAELSKYSTNKLGAHFSKKPFSTKEKVAAIIEKTHVMHPDEVIFNGMYGWDLVCGEYVAEGGEKYITIGNFTTNMDVKDERNKKPREMRGQQIIAAYYYIDDISVELLDQDEQCDCPYKDEKKQVSATIYQRSPVLLENMSLANRIKEYNIFYASGRYNLTISGDETLNEIAKLMKENPDLKIRIIGHTDELESESEDMSDTSKKRAEYIRSQMVNKDVDASRFAIKDAQHSSTAPFISENDDEQVKNAKNRRVSFEVIE